MWTLLESLVETFTPLTSWTSSWGAIFCILWIHRYLRLLVHSISSRLYRSKPIPVISAYCAKDVTVIVPTIHNMFEELRPSLESILACHPCELILVTTVDKFDALNRLAKSLSSPRIRVFQTGIANKRIQLCAGLARVMTPITIMADDDVTWPSTMISGILAPFTDPRMGAVGTFQRVKREPNANLVNRMFNFLGAAYIERRNFEISATHNIDGGTSCMSGRTGAYRTEILQSPDFLRGFQTERWFGYSLNADDDNFVTRWLVSNQWKTWVQKDESCVVETTMEPGFRYLYQCSRWARTNWRSNFTSLVVERHVWRQQPWCLYALHLATFTSLSVVFDPAILLLLDKVTENWTLTARICAFTAQLVFMFAFTKTVKLWPLFRRNPSDLVYMPLVVMFGYFHGLMKLYALATITNTSWGSRADGDLDDMYRLQRQRRSDSISLPTSKQSGIDAWTPRQRRMTTSILDEKILFARHETFSSSPPAHADNALAAT